MTSKFKTFKAAALVAGLSLIAPLTACTKQGPVAKPEAKTYGAYIVVMGKDYKASELGAYAGSLPPIYAKYGGEYIAFSTDTKILEGQYGYQSLIISGWPSVEAAQAFWASPEYIDAKKLRDGIGTFDVVVVPSLTFKNQ